MSPSLRYLAAACQTDLPNPRDRSGIAAQVDHMLGMIDRAVVGYRPFGEVRLIAFPEFGHAAPIYATVEELRDRLAVAIPNEHTERYHKKARQYGVFIQTASFLEADPRYPGHVFNTTCLIGPEGCCTATARCIPWMPWEVHTSPHDCLPRLRRSAVPRGRDRDRHHRHCDLLRLALSRGDSRTGVGGRGGAGARVGVHGPVGRDAADGLVDRGQPLPGPGKPGLRRGRQSGGLCRPLSAVLLARRQHDRGL